MLKQCKAHCWAPAVQVDQPAGGDGAQERLLLHAAKGHACLHDTTGNITAVTGCTQVLKKLLESAKKREAEAAQNGAAKNAELEKLKVSSAVHCSTSGHMKMAKAANGQS